jgi:glutamate racemase
LNKDILAQKSTSPIGIFDSGIGGLTVAKAISALLPNEELVYFGDTMHMPYGEKSVNLIRAYALKITDFLLNVKKCKAIVIACNTASAAAYEVLRDMHKGNVPVINVIDPMVEAVIADNLIKKVGVIATKTTVKSGTYQEKFFRRKPKLEFTALATPLLASMIEEGFFNNNISTAILEKYLSQPELNNIDALVLACTHYPLIKNEINTYYESKVKIFDSAEVVAARLKWILEKENLTTPKRSKDNVFYISDYTESFAQTAQQFFGGNLQLKEKNLWE